MNILLYGSSFPTEVAERALIAAGHNVMYHVPCVDPAFPGLMTSPSIRAEYVHSVFYDIALSVFYDRKVTRLDAAYNIHPGLLPRWAGCNILYHTVLERVRQQGLTLHKMTHDFDRGPIISRVTYPVFSGDKVVDLYSRMLDILPGFVVSSVDLLSKLPRIPNYPFKNFRYYRRENIPNPEVYAQAGYDIRDLIAKERV